MFSKLFLGLVGIFLCLRKVLDIWIPILRVTLVHFFNWRLIRLPPGLCAPSQAGASLGTPPRRVLWNSFHPSSPCPRSVWIPPVYCLIALPLSLPFGCKQMGLPNQSISQTNKQTNKQFMIPSFPTWCLFEVVSWRLLVLFHACAFCLLSSWPRPACRHLHPPGVPPFSSLGSSLLK